MKRQKMYRKAIQIRLDPMLDAKLEKYCIANSVSKSEAVRRWIMTLPDVVGGEPNGERTKN